MLKRFDVRLTILIITLTTILASLGISAITLIGITIISIIASRIFTAPLRQLTQLAEIIQTGNKPAQKKLQGSAEEFIILEKTLKALNTRIQNSIDIEKKQVKEFETSQTLLSRSEAQYRQMVETANEGIWSIDLEGETLFANQQMADLLGYELKQLQQMNLFEAIHEEDRPGLVKRLNDRSKGISHQHDIRFIHKNGHDVWALVSATPMTGDDGKVYGSIGFITDITERIEAQQQLAEREQHYKIINDLMSDYAFYVSVDADGNSVSIWRTGAYLEVLGYDRPQLGVPVKLEDFVHPDDLLQVKQNHERLLNNETTTSLYRSRHSAGGYIWIEAKRQPVWDEDEGRVTGFYGAARDITKQIETQQQLTEREQRYKIINDLISDYAAYVQVDAEGELYNGWMIGAYTEMLGYEVSDTGTHVNLEQFVHPEDASLLEQAIKGVLNNETTTTVYRAKHKEGHYIWMEVTRQPIWDEDEGRVTGFYSAARNVSDRMQTQQRLEESEQNYRIINDLISDYAAYVRVDAEGELYNGWMIGPYAEMIGFDVPETGGHINLENFIHPEDYPQVEQAIKQLLNNETTTTVYRALHKEGHYTWLEVTRQPVWDEGEGRVTGFYSATRDVTERMEAQLRLQENETWYKQVSELMSDFTYEVIVNTEGSLNQRWRSGADTDILGYGKWIAGSFAKPHENVHPDDLQIAKQALEQVLNNKRITATYRARHNAGHYAWLEVTRQPIWNENEGRVTGFYAAARNVTERMEAQLRLKQSEQRYKRVSDLMSDYAYYIHIDVDEKLYNGWVTGAYTDILGYDIPPLDSPVRLNASVHPDDLAEVRETIQQTLNNESTTTTYRAKHEAGYYVWLEVTRQPIWGEDEGRVTGFYGAARDVTGRMEAQLSLQENETWYKQVSELMSDFTYEVAIDHNRVFHNGWRGATDTDILGYNRPMPDSFIDPYAVIHPDDIEIAKQAFEQLHNNKRTTVTYRAKHKAGHYIWLEVTRQPIWKEEEGRVTGFYGAARDVTDRMEAQLRLKESEARYKRVSDLMSDYAFSVKVDADYNVYNEWIVGAFEEILGYPVLEPGAPANMMRTHPDDMEHRNRAIEEVLTNRIVTNSFRVKHKDGHYIWLEVTRQPIWDEEEGRVTGFYGAARDVTDRMEAQLRIKESETLYRQVSELMTDYTFSTRVNTDGTLQREWVAGAFEEILGYGIEETATNTRPGTIHPDDLELYEQITASVLNNEAVTERYRVQHKAGHFIWLEVTRRPVWDEEQGRVTHYYGAARDVTDRMEAQLHLQESEERFRAMANTAPILIWMSDKEQRTSYFNDTWLNFTGRSIVEELGDGWKDNIHPDDYDYVIESSETGHQKQTTVNIEYRLRRHDGEYRYVQDVSVPLFLENGDYAGFIGTCTDITAQRDAKLELERLVAQKTSDLQEEISLRKLIEAQLIRERNLLQSTMETSPIAIFVMNDDGNIEFANDSAHQLLSDPANKSEKGIDNSPFLYFLDADGIPFAEGESLLDRIIQTGKALYDQEVSYKNSLLEDRTLSLNLAPLSDLEGVVSEVIITARDITLERKSEEQIKAALQEEKQLNQIRSRFISIITHEFKTPLTVIKIACDTARRGHSKMDKEQLLVRFERIEQQGKRLNALVDDVVKLNRTNSTEYTVLRESIAIPDLIYRVTGDVLMAYENQTSAEYDFQPEQHSANLDATLTHQFLTNLIGNAVKYNDTGARVRIASHITDNHLEIVIQDEGIGIPEDDLPYLFGDFFRASNTGAIEGTGLGLAIAKRAIELQGGTISVQSVENEGTTFRIQLPLEPITEISKIK